MSAMVTAEFSLIVPARDEVATIVETIEQVAGVLEATDRPFELIVVDDGSTDGTTGVVAALVPDRAWLTLLTLPTPSGKGAALKAGFTRAVGPTLGFVDADLQIPVAALGEALRAAAGAGSMVVGRRRGRRIGPTRGLLSFMYRLCSRVLLGVTVSDVGCPLKVFPRGLVEGAPVVSDRWVVDAELLARARVAGLSLIEIDVSSNERGRASKVGPGSALESVADLLRVRAAMRERARA
jgi:glycosyltransferase involved in cell wall biosynthesis